MTLTEKLQKKADLIKNSSEEINNTKSIRELYNLIDKVNDAVKTFYPHIGCSSQCFLCCQHSNVPTATSIEWELVHSFIANSPKKFQDELIQTTKKLFSTHGNYLKRIHLAINSQDDKLKLKESYEVLPKFLGKSCIFLKEGFCSVYNSRPAKCRTQGYSTMNFDDKTQMQTCVPEMLKIEEVFQKTNIRKVLMPSWNDYEQQIQKLISGDALVVSVLPVWVYAHIKEEQFELSLNLNPDFESILAEF